MPRDSNCGRYRLKVSYAMLPIPNPIKRLNIKIPIEMICLDRCNYERYIVTMIRTFKHSGLRRYFKTGDPKGLAAQMAKRIQIRLNVLNRARELRDIALPGFDSHPLKGNRKGEYAIGVAGNHRMTFRFDGGDVLDLNLEDYH